MNSCGPETPVVVPGGSGNIHDTLSQSNLFFGIEENIRNEIIKRGDSVVLEDGKTLFHEGMRASRCYLLLKGRLKLTKLHEDGKSLVVSYVESGEIIGLISLFGQKDYPVSAEAVKDSELVGWGREVFKNLITEFPRLALNIIEILINRLHDTQIRYLELYAERVEKRIARALLRLMRQSGKKIKEGILIDFPISRQELAEYTGTTLFSVSRVIASFEKKGWIISKRERIIISNPHELILFAETL